MVEGGGATTKALVGVRVVGLPGFAFRYHFLPFMADSLWSPGLVGFARFREGRYDLF